MEGSRAIGPLAIVRETGNTRPSGVVAGTQYLRNDQYGCREEWVKEGGSEGGRKGGRKEGKDRGRRMEGRWERGGGRGGEEGEGEIEIEMGK